MSALEEKCLLCKKNVWNHANFEHRTPAEKRTTIEIIFTRVEIMMFAF